MCITTNAEQQLSLTWSMDLKNIALQEYDLVSHLYLDEFKPSAICFFTCFFFQLKNDSVTQFLRYLLLKG